MNQLEQIFILSDDPDLIQYPLKYNVSTGNSIMHCILSYNHTEHYRHLRRRGLHDANDMDHTRSLCIRVDFISYGWY